MWCPLAKQTVSHGHRPEVLDLGAELFITACVHTAPALQDAGVMPLPSHEGLKWFIKLPWVFCQMCEYNYVDCWRDNDNLCSHKTTSTKLIHLKQKLALHQLFFSELKLSLICAWSKNPACTAHFALVLLLWHHNNQKIGNNWKALFQWWIWWQQPLLFLFIYQSIVIIIVI